MSEIIHVDFDIIDTYTMKDPEFEKEFIAMALESIQTALINISDAIAADDFEKIKALSHKLKGAASMAGLMEINRIAKAMNQLTVMDKGIVDDLFTQLSNETPLAAAILQKFLDDHS